MIAVPVEQREDEKDLRGLVFSIAYRMTGSVAEAEDLVQDAFLRFERARRSGVVVESPKAYLAAVTTRLAIDRLRSARVRRETYVGTWLPEPIVADLYDGPEPMAELSDSLSMAFLVLLESLSPVERAVFLLREVFEFSYEDIARIVDKSDANCRQIFGRAKRHLHSPRPRHEALDEHGRALLRSFLAAARGGDLNQLVDLLATDAVFYGDGGGKATALGRPLQGRQRVASFVLAVFGRISQLGARTETERVNGGPGIVTYDSEDRILSVLAIEFDGDVIRTVRAVVNPDKLQHLGPVSDVLRLRPDD